MIRLPVPILGYQVSPTIQRDLGLEARFHYKSKKIDFFKKERTLKNIKKKQLP